jgi:hypothetical protein
MGFLGGAALPNIGTFRWVTIRKALISADYRYCLAFPCDFFYDNPYTTALSYIGISIKQLIIANKQKIQYNTKLWLPSVRENTVGPRMLDIS